MSHGRPWGMVQFEFQLVGFSCGPGFDAASAKIGGELLREPVHGQHPSGLDEFDEAQQLRIIGVIGKGEGGIAAMAENRRPVDRPARD